MDKAEIVFYKLAKLSREEKLVREVEKEVGLGGLNLMDRSVALDSARNEYNNRFSLRHPILTGIPTFGIAPAIARNEARETILRSLVRANKPFGDYLVNKAIIEEQKAIRAYRLETERIKADQAGRAASALGGAAIGVTGILANRNRDANNN